MIYDIGFHIGFVIFVISIIISIYFRLEEDFEDYKD
jgi:hypothetical protein